MLGGAGRWVTAGITTMAALAALLVNARNLGINSWLGLADYSAARLVVAPRADTLFAIGDTLPLAATVTDARGAVLIGTSLTWRSDDSAVAIVDSTGSVIAVGSGVARVTASVRELRAEAKVIVRPRVAQVTVGPDSVLRIREGDTLPLAAQTLDARGHALHRPIRWRSDDSLVAVVDSLGRAMALAPGRTALTAAAEGYEAHLTVDVLLAPARLEHTAGDNQRVPAGAALPEPIVVQVLSPGGRPVPDVPVQFSLADPEGRVEPDTVRTDIGGRARARWTLSPRPGRQHLLVRVATLDSGLAVVAEADPVPGNTRVEQVGGPPMGRVTEMLAEPVVVRVTDSTGTALADVPVTWLALDKGALEPAAPRTDSLGETRARWTLGPNAGRQRARLQVGNARTVPPFTAAALADPGPPAAIAVLAGSNQRGPVGKGLPKAVVLAVRDAHGNPVPRTAVTVRPVHGTVSDSAAVTDSAGRARLSWTLGRSAGNQLLEVRVAGIDSVARVRAMADAAGAANVAFRDPPASATVGTRRRVVVTVTDAYGNPVRDALVVFTPTAGTVSASRVASDGAGAAATVWTPGAPAGEQRLTATVRGTSVTAAHAVRVTVPPTKRK